MLTRHKATANWFHNRQQDIKKGTGKGVRGSAPQAGTRVDHDFDAPLDVTPILKMFKTRARAASVLWADEHQELIAQERENKTIGSWRQTVRKLFSALSPEAREKWFDKARRLKADAQTGDEEEWFEYVH